MLPYWVGHAHAPFSASKVTFAGNAGNGNDTKGALVEDPAILVGSIPISSLRLGDGGCQDLRSSDINPNPIV